jgi:hypothetical protein
MTETKCREIGRIYRKLRDIEDALSEPVQTAGLAQEILDFLAMAAGLKPVFLLGRGLDAPQWITGVAELAAELGFHAVQGPFWDATPLDEFPAWYRDHTVVQLAPYRAVYVCAAGDTAREIATVNAAGGRLSMTTEARLLGYPDCCVVAHYDRAVRYHRAIVSILRRLAGDDQARMQALLRGDAGLAPETPREIDLMEAAFDLKPAIFGSWNQCPSCALHDDSPSADLSRKYISLAETINPELCQKLADRF